MSYIRFMRLILFFDLPNVTKKEAKEYRKFLKGIKRLGFYMLQESVYVKMAIDNQSASFVTNRIYDVLPPNGNVFVLTITEKQFASMNILLGNFKTDVISTSERVVII